jgi:zinc protease
MRIVIVTKDGKALRDAIVANEPSPITYNSPKAPEILEEDKAIAAFTIPAKPDAITIRPASEVFE